MAESETQIMYVFYYDISGKILIAVNIQNSIQIIIKISESLLNLYQIWVQVVLTWYRIFLSISYTEWKQSFLGGISCNQSCFRNKINSWIFLTSLQMKRLGVLQNAFPQETIAQNTLSTWVILCWTRWKSTGLTCIPACYRGL